MSVRMEQLGSQWTDFHEIWYLSIFSKKLSRKFEFYWKIARITGTLHEDVCTYLITSRSVILRMINVSGRRFKKKSKHAFYVRWPFPFFSEKKILRLWDNVVKYSTDGQAADGNITWRMRFACRITKVTNTHLEYVTLIAFPLQQWLR